MNIDQLESLRREIAIMRTIIEADPTGSVNINDAIDKLANIVIERLKDEVWAEYLEASSRGT